MTNPIDADLTTKIADPQDRTAQDHALVSQWQQAHQNARGVQSRTYQSSL